MKKFKQIIILTLTMTFISGCNRSVDRADRVITQTQDAVNGLISDIGEVQHLENQLQDIFEEMIQSDEELASFENQDAPIYENINMRRDYIKSIRQHLGKFEGLQEEMHSQIEKAAIDTVYLVDINQLMGDLKEQLTVYTDEYDDNLVLEETTYKALANPETDYSNFFKFFDNIAIITANNQMNLEKAIGYFEPINANLTNFKVYLVNLGE